MAFLAHMAMATKNNLRLARFYRLVFDMVEAWNPNHNSPYSLHVSDGYFDLHSLLIRPGREPEVGMNHLGFCTPDLEEVKSKLASRLIEVTASPPDGRWEEFRLTDPDGNNLELSKRGWPTYQGRDPLVRHVGIQTADHERLADFYQSVFEMKEVEREVGSVSLSDGRVNLGLVKSDFTGIRVIGFQVPSIAEIESRLKNSPPYLFPGEPPIEIHESHRGYFLLDPDGNRVDLSERGWKV